MIRTVRAAAYRARLLVGCAVVLGAFAGGCGSDPEAADQDTGVVDTAEDTATDAADIGAEDTADGANWTGKCAAGPGFCDDGNPCTVDHCDPLTGCFTEPMACADDDPCTLDACDPKAGGCTHSQNACDDDNVCTEGSCDAAKGCVYTLIACDDGDACSSDGCSPATGCVHGPLSCDDHITCTVDSCDTKTGCAHVAPEGAKCCENAVDCEDDNVCTQHACVAGVCQTAPIFGCCKQDADCDDGNPCTTDACTKASGTCSNAYVPGPGCCQNDIECDDGNLCTVDACFAGQCGHDVTCCKDAAECAPAAAVGLCAAATCTDGLCGFALQDTGATCCAATLAQTGFEAADTLATKLVPAKNGVFSVTDGSSAEVHGGAASLRYEVQTQAVAGGQSVARAALPPIDLPLGSAPQLRFWVRTQLSGGTLADKLRLRAETSIGARYLWQAKPVQGWTEVTIPLRGYAGRAATHQVRLVFEVSPGSNVWSGSKAFIDDVVLDQGCTKAAGCSVDADCDDGLGATTGTCSQGACVWTAGAGYCENNTPCNDKNVCTADSCGENFACGNVELPDCCTKTAECNDDNPCTQDVCSASKCKHTAAPGSVCCNSVGDCDDSNPCTLDSCPVVGLPCQHTQTDPTCCVSATDCDDSQACTLDTCVSNGCQHKQQCCTTEADCADGDECTSDACAAGICSFALLEKPGCCVPTMLDAGFESSDISPFVLTSQLATSKWQQVSGKQAKDGKGALYYGNLAKGNFDDGQSTGEVTWKGVEVPAGEQTTLSFALWMDTEMGTSYDRFEVRVVVDGKTIKLWDKNAAGFTLKAWYEGKVGLSAFGGKTVDVVFAFDTNDGVANTGEGVYLDAIKLQRACAQQTCNAAADCDDGVATTTDACTAGACAYTY